MIGTRAPVGRFHVAPPPYRVSMTELSEWFKEPEIAALAHLKLWLAQNTDIPRSRGARRVRAEIIRDAYFDYRNARRRAGLSDPPMTLLDREDRP